jgi:hypothetical protein
MLVSPAYRSALVVGKAPHVDALRSLMLEASTSAYGLAFDFAVQGFVLLGLVALAARLYPTVAV